MSRPQLCTDSLQRNIFYNSVLQPLQKATQVKEFINNTNTRDPKANTK